MGYVLNLQASIGRGGIDKGGKDQVGTIWEGIHLAKHIDKQRSKVSLQAKEYMDKVKARSLKEISTIKAKIHSTIALVKNLDQGQRRLIESLKSEVKILKRGIIYSPHLEQWSEDMDLEITLVL